MDYYEMYIACNEKVLELKAKNKELEESKESTDKMISDVKQLMAEPYIINWMSGQLVERILKILKGVE